MKHILGCRCDGDRCRLGPPLESSAQHGDEQGKIADQFKPVATIPRKTLIGATLASLCMWWGIDAIVRAVWHAVFG